MTQEGLLLTAGRLTAEMRGGEDEDTEPQELSNKADDVITPGAARGQSLRLFGCQ